ncbi:MAG: aldehyde dehydrogenase family protein, partial [Bacteroidota bacterium]|nr:aldehyde dehydrogenase family protein [Bacteroidota bacterium]
SFFPYALVCGNTYLVKPSEKVPMTITRIFELFETLELPKGVLSLIHGGKDTVNAILNHPSVNAISFVGSNTIANYVYKLGTANGKRMQVHGGAKNYIVVLPDADIHTTVSAVANNAFCFAGQHCQAVSTVILVNEAFEHITPKLIEAAQAKKCGYGMDPSAEVGPVISNESRKRIKELIQQGIDEGAELLLDGRVVTVKGFEDGYFIKPTILSNIKQDSTLHTTEIIGPVLGLIQVETLEEAIKLINSRDCENSASLFTQNGVAARKFRYDILAKNVGINMGIAAPIPITTFGSRKDLFLVALHQQANQTIDFYTQTKLVKERWQTE